MALMEVRYKGLSDYRILTASDLKDSHGIVVGQHTGVPKRVADRINSDLRGVDVNPQKDLVWGPHNGFKLIIDVDENLERVLRDELHFSLSAVTDSGGVMPIAEARTELDNPSEVIANVDGGHEQRNTVDPRDEVPGSGEAVSGPGPASTDMPSGTRGPRTTGRTGTKGGSTATSP